MLYKIHKLLLQCSHSLWNTDKRNWSCDLSLYFPFLLPFHLSSHVSYYFQYFQWSYRRCKTKNTAATFLKIKTFIFIEVSVLQKIKVQTNPMLPFCQCPLLLTSCNGMVHFFNLLNKYLYIRNCKSNQHWDTMTSLSKSRRLMSSNAGEDVEQNGRQNDGATRLTYNISSVFY